MAMYNYKGEKASYYAIHMWVSSTYGHPEKCEHCSKKGEKMGKKWNIEYANLSGKFLRERSDWKTLCRSCHRKFDLKNGLVPQNRGEKHVWAKFNRTIAENIRKEYKPYVVTAKFLANKYGTSAGTIRDIVSYKSWKNYGNT